MGWRYAIGAGLSAVQDAILARAPAIRAIPAGHWPYDVRRFAGRRRIGPIFDVGANIGQTAASLVRYFPDDPLYCFEPVAATFEVLQRRFGQKASCIRAALGAAKGTAEIALYANSELNTLAPQGSTIGDRIGVEPVEVMTLDDFCSDRKIDSIGLLKMDVQGWELSVLDGARRLLDRKAIAMVLTEVCFQAGLTDMLPFSLIHERMLAEGFSFSGLYEQFRYGPAKQFVSFANAIYTIERPPL